MLAGQLISSQQTEHDFLTLSGNQRLLLDSSEVVWVVQDGKADIYAVAIENNQPAGRLLHLFRAELGQTLFGLDKAFGNNNNMRLMVTGIPGTQIMRRKRADLLKRARERKSLQLAESAAYMVESWVIDLYRSIIEQAPPTRFKLLMPGEELSVKEGDILRPRDDIIWVRHKDGCSKVAGKQEMSLTPDRLFYPLAADGWLVIEEDGVIECTATVSLIDFNADDAECGLWNALDLFQVSAPHCIEGNRVLIEKAELEKLNREIKLNETYLGRAFSYLGSVITRDDYIPGEEEEAPLIRVCRKVFRSQKIEMAVPPQWILDNRNTHRDVIKEIAKASNVRCREVALEGNWWERDNGMLVVFDAESSAPLALLPDGSGNNVLFDPATGTKIKVGHQEAAALEPRAMMFYRSLPDRSLSARDVLHFVAENTWKKDLMLLLAMGILGGLLGLVFPLVTGIVFDQVIPAASQHELIFLAQFLLVSAAAIFTFNVVRALAMLRIESRLDSSMQAAILDRILKLPLSFFDDFTAGDLGSRALGIINIRQIISGLAANTVFTAMFSLLNFIIIFYYIPALAWLALLLVLTIIAFTIYIGRAQVHLLRKVTNVYGRINGFLLQVFDSITRFRMAGAENRVYYLWARYFAEQRKNSYKSRLIGNYLTTFSFAFPVLAALFIYGAFYTFGGGRDGTVSAGIFLGFNAAFTGMLTALMSLSEQYVSLMQAVPIADRLKPIIESKPEIDESRLDPGELKGDIEASRISFWYNRDDPPVLNDLSLKVKAGQFTAIVGSSGSGKSTFFKMLLGFLEPEKGTIYFDGQDLSHLDMRYVRQQLGVVLQNDRLMPGSILQNILGATNLTMDDAWEAARLAGIAEDIEHMPMGMHTMIAEGGSTFSGGQQQRLLIARAIVKKPRIIMFDEATSALDNRTQQLITESLDQLKATRLVIAHRLSTIINADMIYVLDRGRVIQGGTYSQLMAEEGVFKQLAERQMV